METLPGLGGSVSTEWDILAQYQQPELPISRADRGSAGTRGGVA